MKSNMAQNLTLLEFVSQNKYCAKWVPPCANMFPMSALVDDAVKILRSLPGNVQANAARAIIEYGSGYDEEAQLSDAQVEEVERRMSDPDRAFLTLDETRSQLRHFGI